HTGRRRPHRLHRGLAVDLPGVHAVTPRSLIDRDLDVWADRAPYPARFTGPGEEATGIEPCEALILTGDEIAVPWTLDEIELAHLAQGGTLWLVVRGHLPVHGMLVQEPVR